MCQCEDVGLLQLQQGVVFLTFSHQSSLSRVVSCCCFKVICVIRSTFLCSLLCPCLGVITHWIWVWPSVKIWNATCYSIWLCAIWFCERECCCVLSTCVLSLSDLSVHTKRDCEMAWHLNNSETIHYWLESLPCSLCHVFTEGSQNLYITSIYTNLYSYICTM